MITYDEGNRRFNYRVGGVAIDDGKVLLSKAEGDSFWTFPGGRAEFGEPAAQTLKREMLEELNTEVEVVRLLWMVENFFEYEGREYHELGLYFLMRFPGGSEILRQSQPFYGNEQGILLTLQWVPHDFDTLSKLSLLPAFLRVALQKLPETTQHIVYYDHK
jgi:ADP-ribose pyrophosphatase YjhB (NUDIX family)